MDILRQKDAILQYADCALPAPAETVAVAEGVRWLRMPLPFDLDHINLWLIADGPRWAAVDTGIASDATREAWLPILARHSLSRLVITHMHPDHVGLASWLQEQSGDLPLAMTLGEFATAQAILEQIGPWSFAAIRELYRRHGLPAEYEAQLAKRGSMYKRGVPNLPATYQRLIDGDAIAIGGHAWQVICGYGHSPEHASFYCAELGVLIAGDMVLPRISTNISIASSTPDEDPLARFLASLARLRALPAETLVLPSHGRPFRGLHARIAQLTAHHHERCEALVAALDRPRSAAEMLPVLFSRVLNDPLQIFFALGEAIAHLNHLVRAGSLVADERDSVIHFARP